MIGAGWALDRIFYTGKFDAQEVEVLNSVITYLEETVHKFSKKLTYSERMLLYSVNAIGIHMDELSDDIFYSGSRKSAVNKISSWLQEKLKTIIQARDAPTKQRFEDSTNFLIAWQQVYCDRKEPLVRCFAA